MKRLNNKGFAISTILFSILILGTLVFGTLYATTISNNTCQNGCCEPPCEIPEKEEVNTCTIFKDFTCPGEFTIGSEHFCVLNTYSNRDTSINDKVVVALAKYFVNGNQSKNDISPYGLQYKYAICEGMYSTSITKDRLNIDKGYYSILNNNSKLNTHINNPKEFNARPIWNASIGNEVKKYDYDLPKLSSKISLESNPLNDLSILYYDKLKQMNNQLSSLSVRLINLRDLDDENKFPCNSPARYNGQIARVRDDIDGDHDAGRFFCNNVSDDNQWIYFPTANPDVNTKYFTDIITVSGNKIAYIYSIDSTFTIGKEYYSGYDFYDDYYFRPVIELSKTEYDSLPKV